MSLPRWVPWVAVLAVGIAAFSAGRFSAPEVVQTVVEEKVVYRDRVVEVRGKTETRIVYRDRVVKPDGEIREKTEERTATREDLERDASRTGASERTDTRTTTTRPDWRVGVLAGVSLREPAVPIAGPLVLGVQVERRIIGGVSAGAWVNTVGAAGAVVSVEF